MSHLQAGFVTIAVCVIAGVQLLAFLLGRFMRS
jgi:hypothetical protein